MTTIHDPWCQSKAFPHEDAAKRISDEYNTHRIADPYGSIGKWFAAAIHDGTCDHVLYDSKRDAVIHQHHNENYYTYIKIGPHTSNACEAAVMLKTARMLYDNGMRMADPDDRHGGKDLIKRSTWDDVNNAANGRNTNLMMPWEA